MHVLIIFLIFRINSTSSEISKINQNYAKYKAEASSMLGGSSTLSEAVASLLLRPTLVTNEINTVPLTIFADEVADKTRRGSTISEHFSTYSLSEDITTSIQAAAEASDRLLEADLHALALFFAAYGKPNIPQIASLEVPALTESEKKLDQGELLALAAMYANGPTFASDKLQMVGEVNAAMGMLERESGQASGAGLARVGRLQLMIRITTFTIIGLIIILLLILYFQLISPMYSIVRNIRTGTLANEKKGLREIRLISAAYNRLINRRANFEDFLRSTSGADVSETIPDRAAFDQFMDSEETAPEGKPLSLILFDFADYETTKKDLGENAAKQLLKTGVECIVKCFGNDSGSNCFVIEKTRFAAVVADTTKAGIDESVEMFAGEQSKWGISIFWGVAFTESYKRDALIDLNKEAERKLYIQKKVMFRDV